MSERRKILLGWLAFSFVIFHIVSIFFTAFPGNYIPSRVKKMAEIYTYPIFTQNWSMFAPCPILDGRLEVCYFFKGKSTGWQRPLQDEWDKHALFRMTYHAELALGEANLLYWVDVDVKKMNLRYDQPMSGEIREKYLNGYSYSKVQDFLEGTAIYLYEEKPDSAYAKCHFKNVVSQEEGDLILPVFRWKD